jgi:hypothetical protein
MRALLFLVWEPSVQEHGVQSQSFSLGAEPQNIEQRMSNVEVPFGTASAAPSTFCGWLLDILRFSLNDQTGCRPAAGLNPETTEPFPPE